jgi:hypothetical protein
MTRGKRPVRVGFSISIGALLFTAPVIFVWALLLTTPATALIGDQLPGLRLIGHCVKPSIANGDRLIKPTIPNGRYLVVEVSFAGANGVSRVFASDFHLKGVTAPGKERLFECLAVGHWEESHTLPGEEPRFLPQRGPCLTMKSGGGSFCLVFYVPKEVKSVGLYHLRNGLASVGEVSLD